MREILNALAQAIGDQAIAVGTVADQVRALKQTLARQFPELADELKGQMAEEQEKNRTDIYELQVSLAKVREAIAQLPEAKTMGGTVERKRRPPQSKTRAGASKARARR